MNHSWMSVKTCSFIFLQIIQQWESAGSMFVDDFIYNGTEQMLILPSAQTTEPLQGFILTDLDACYVIDKVRLVEALYVL